MTAKIKEFPGVYLKESDFQEGKVLFTEWNPNAQYAWDAGVAIGRYLHELKAGRLIGVRCNQCRRTVIPPRNFCEWCFRPMDDWVSPARHRHRQHLLPVLRHLGHAVPGRARDPGRDRHRRYQACRGHHAHAGRGGSRRRSTSG